MIKLPSTTIVNRRIPKDRFYSGRSNAAELKALFTEAVEKVVWANKLSPNTMNFPPSEEIREIEIFETTLGVKAVDRRLYAAMDEAVKPHVVLHIIKALDHIEVVMGFRQPGDKTARYYARTWADVELVELDFASQSLDALYLSLMRQLSGGVFAVDSGASVADAKAKNARRQTIEAAIGKLERELKKEKQINRQFEISGEIRKLKKELKAL